MKQWMQAVFVAVAVAALPGSAIAQTCVGVPAVDGQSAAAFELGAFQDGGALIGTASGTMNVVGPFSLGGSYGITSFDNIDSNMHTLGGQAAYEIPTDKVATCAVGGVGYGSLSMSGFSTSTLTVPVGVGIGYTVEASPGVDLIPHAIPSIMITRTSAEVAGTSDTETQSTFGGRVGVTAVLQEMYLIGGIQFSNEENSDSVLSVGAGITF